MIRDGEPEPNGLDVSGKPRAAAGQFPPAQKTVDELTAIAAATGLAKRKVIQQAIADFAAKHRHESSDVPKSRLRGRG